MGRSLGVGLLLLCSGVAAAHERSASYSLWDLNAHPPQVQLRLAQIDLTRVGLHPGSGEAEYAARVSDYIVRHLQLQTDQHVCRLHPQQLHRTSDGWLSWRADIACPNGQGLRIHSSLLTAVLSAHLHVATIRHAGQTRDAVLSARQPVVFIGDARAPQSSLIGYVRLGIDHILSGWDHLLFVLGLLLLARRVSELLWLISGFTVAHSLTLAAAVLGWVQPQGDAIEALIGLSLLVVAAELAWQRGSHGSALPIGLMLLVLVVAVMPAASLPWLTVAGMLLLIPCYFALLQASDAAHRWRALLAVAFGLVHGFGFAGLLTEMALPAETLLPALLGFNLGVEAGQLLVIAMAWPVLVWLRRWPTLRLSQAGTALIAGFGSYWFVLRALT